MLMLDNNLKQALESFVLQMMEKDNEEYVDAMSDIVNALSDMLKSRDNGRAAMLLTHSDKGFGVFAVCPTAMHAIALLYTGMNAIRRSEDCANLAPETETVQ